uniref:NB-ARC domain-containing protein n=1 Tax=Oryza meridionalis TaxID=40149 RepID=A0A0E0F5X8_9ORYZ
MAGLFASSAVKWAIDNISSLLPPAAGSSQGLDVLEELRKLERTMRRIHATLHDAEQRWNIREESAKLRLEELKELAYDAEDVVEEYEYEVNRRKVEALERLATVHGGGGGGASKRKREEVHEEHFSTESGIVPVPSELADRTRTVIQRFCEIKDYCDSFSLSDNDGDRRIVPDINAMRQTSSFVFAPRILGREKDMENVIAKLLSGEGSRVGGCMSVLAIVGMGGLGKTTLAQLVYNNPTVQQSFDLYGWVYVSECFDVSNITRKIISSLTQNNCDHIQSGELQGALANRIKDKRVFLVLDDIWNERSDYWELLITPMFASRCCDIIVTTRNERVARLVQTTQIYNLNSLSPDESWSLFKQTTFIEQENISPANLVEIARMVSEKCKGLPLVIKTVGSILRFETDEIKWRDVLQSELWDLEQTQNEVLPVLELSYKHMPIYLKQCFVALSLYPKYYYLDENMVVWLWKLLGLLQSDEIYNRDEIGKLYFNELVQRSLLQSSIHGQKVMHDLVHDLACFLAGEEFFRLEEDKQTEVPRGARYMSIMPKPLSKKRIQISNSSQSLRAIIVIMGDIDIVNPEVLFTHCKKLRIIYVVQGSVQKALLDFIGGMKLLRHLTLSGYECAAHLSRPNSMSQLFNLQTLNMQAYTLLKIGRLVNLQTLPEIHLMKCGCFVDIRELRNMNKIRKLCIRGLRNVPSIIHADEAHLQSKRNLEVLELDFDEFFLHKDFVELRSCEHTEHRDANEAAVTLSRGQLLEKLRPHCQSLKVLRIQNLNHGNYPSWLGSASFSKLTELKLQACQSQHLPTLGELPSLKSLDIRQMVRVEHIGHEFCSLDRRFKGFPALRDLSFHGMNRLSEWSGVEDGEFPRLEALLFWDAFELRSLPLVPFLSLRKFTLIDCRNLVTFPASATLQELNISICEKLKELPSLPSLQSLHLFNCPSLVAFGHFPSLTILYLADPFKEEILHRLVNSHLRMEELTISSNTLKSICLEPQSLPSLRSLEIRCPNLQCCDTLASISSLKKLNISASPRLHVPNSLRSQLEELYTAESF